MILLLSVSVISASPEFWIGGSFIADRNMVSSELSSSFPAMGEDISQIRSLGVSVDMAFFPWNEVRVGLVLSSLTQLPIGITERGGSNEGYITYDFDFREDLMVGIGYHQFFTDKIGMVLSAGFYYSWYRTAMEHIANESAPMEYIQYGDMLSYPQCHTRWLDCWELQWNEKKLPRSEDSLSEDVSDIRKRTSRQERQHR